MDEIHVISLGAGVQSSTMALMAAAGEIMPMPNCAIFADTQAEPDSVYRWLDWLETQLPFPVHRVTKGNLGELAVKLRTSKAGRNYTKPSVPAFIGDGSGKQGLLMRQCTSDFKIEVIQRKLREIRKGRFVKQWIGISSDEFSRMKPATVKHKVRKTQVTANLFTETVVDEFVSIALPHPYITNIWPLIEARMSRADCLRWMDAKHYPIPPRSACVFCPYHSNDEWRRLRDDEPEAFAAAVTFELDLQATMSQVHQFRGIPWLHRSMVPLSDVDFSEPQKSNDFNNECEGMCGL